MSTEAHHRVLGSLQALRHGEEEQARSRLSEAVARRERAESEVESLRQRVERERARLAGASREAARRERSEPVRAVELARQAAFIERLRIAERRARERLAAFRAHELGQARAAEREAEAAHRRHRGEREGLDKHVASLRESARQLAERRADDR